MATLDLLRRAARRLARPTPRPARRAAARGSERPAYRGDHAGAVRLAYEPDPDGDADPGEVVWAWVPFEEDSSQGKDRPVLVVARAGADLLGLMLTSRDHTAEPRRSGDDRHWLDLGSGGWDRQGRPSEVRLDRILRLDPSAVRREGAALDRARFDRVAAALRQLHGW